MLVRDVLRAKARQLIVIEEGRTVGDALALLVAHNIGSLPVVDGRGLLIGIFTERDVLRGVCCGGEGYCKSPLRDVMTPTPVTCDTRDELHAVMGKMSEYKIGQLPVVDGGELVGLVSIGDVVKELFEEVEFENRQLHRYVHGMA